MRRFITYVKYWWYEQEAIMRNDYNEARYWSQLREDLDND